MSLKNQLVLLAQEIGKDIKALKVVDGNLSLLSTQSKENLVTAINELHTLVTSSGGVTINDSSTSSVTQTWSALQSKTAIDLAVSELRNSLVNGAGAAMDTFKELQDALNNDPSFATNIAVAVSNRVRYDAVQTLTVEQQLQALNNLNVGDPNHDFVSDYNAAKA